MGIVVLHQPQDDWVAEVVYAALCRSFTTAQVRRCAYAEFSPASSADVPAAAVLIHPGDADIGTLAHFTTAGRKSLLLGTLGAAVAERIGLEVRGASRITPADAEAVVDAKEPYNVSPVAIRYDSQHALAAVVPYAQRPLCRFDFENEWNNLGFGRIPAHDAAWGVAADVAVAGAHALAHLGNPDGDVLGAYAAIAEGNDHAALWMNRAVGPVDSLEWNIVERFFGDYRHDELTALPYLREIPAGYDAAVTMRLDCDEAIASALPLLELYADHGRPLSLAILTGLEMSADDRAALDRVLAAGGAALSHSVRHMPNWGGSRAAAHAEAEESCDWLESATGAPVRFAVSPFHQNPPLLSIHPLR
jgi:hypothetical protein